MHSSSTFILFTPIERLKCRDQEPAAKPHNNHHHQKKFKKGMTCDKQGASPAPLRAASATVMVKSGPGISAPDSAIVKDVPAIPRMANNE